MAGKPNLFIGSSGEGLEIVRAINERLERDAEVTSWDTAFGPSSYTLEALENALDVADFGAFVFTPDDVSKIRGKDVSAVRDNVILELGLFVGRLGRKRVFIIRPDTSATPDLDFHLPTDILGLTYLTFDANRRDSNLAAAVEPACNKIRKAMTDLGLFDRRKKRTRTKKSTTPESTQPPEPPRPQLQDDDILSILESWMGHRPSEENRKVMYFEKVDQELKLPPGSAKRLLDQAARRWNYFPVRKTEVTILLAEDQSGSLPQVVHAPRRFMGGDIDPYRH